MSMIPEEDANAVAQTLIAQRNQALDEVVACRLEIARLQRKLKDFESGYGEAKTDP